MMSADEANANVDYNTMNANDGNIGGKIKETSPSPGSSTDGGLTAVFADGEPCSGCTKE